MNSIEDKLNQIVMYCSYHCLSMNVGDIFYETKQETEAMLSDVFATDDNLNITVSLLIVYITILTTKVFDVTN